MEIKYNKDDLKRACNIVKTILQVQHKTRGITNINAGEQALKDIVCKYWLKSGNTQERLFQAEKMLLRYKSQNNHLSALLVSKELENANLKEMIAALSKRKTFLERIFGWFQ